MINEDSKEIVFFVLIIGRKQKDAILAALTGTGTRIINTVYGRGSVQAGYLRNVLGLVPEKNKAVITCLISNEKYDAIHGMLVEKFDFDKPNTGIAFTMPVERLSF